MKSPESATNNICVFAAGGAADKAYIDAARQTGELIAEQGFGLVFGGVGGGLMQAVASGARSKGAEVTGVVPGRTEDPYYQKAELKPIVSLNNRLIGAPSLEARKQKMLKLSDAVIALPGGYGTFGEIATVFEIGRGRANRGALSRFTVLNTLGFYDGLKMQLERMHQERMATGGLERAVHFSATPEEAVDHTVQAIINPPKSISRFIRGI